VSRLDPAEKHAVRAALRFLLFLALLLAPWPGLGRAFSALFAGCCDALVNLFTGNGAEVHFSAADGDGVHPWWVTMSAKNVFTGQSYEIPVDARTVGYVRIAVFLAFALAWPLWKTGRGRRALAAGALLILAVVGLTVAFPLVQVLGMVRILGLGVLTQSFLSIGILTLVTYPSMAYALPGLVGWLTLRLGSPPEGDTPTRSPRPIASGG
jgi:hypothetical protein